MGIPLFFGEMLLLFFHGGPTMPWQLLPKEEKYAPPFNIRILDKRSFGREPTVGVHVIKSLDDFHVDPSPGASIKKRESVVNLSWWLAAGREEERSVLVFHVLPPTAAPVVVPEQEKKEEDVAVVIEAESDEALDVSFINSQVSLFLSLPLSLPSPLPLSLSLSVCLSIPIPLSLSSPSLPCTSPLSLLLFMFNFFLPWPCLDRPWQPENGQVWLVVQVLLLHWWWAAETEGVWAGGTGSLDGDFEFHPLCDWTCDDSSYTHTLSLVSLFICW